jgi:hypothetical protein
MTNVVNYVAPRVVGGFLQSNARMRVIMGPFGSGKSSGCCVEIVRRAKEQKIGNDGFRRSRWAVVRNTMPQLRDTTIKTWLSWFPDGSCGWWKETGKTYFIEFGDVRAEVMFRALDDAADVKNLLSLELTGAYINECREIPKEIVEGLLGRIERFPARKDGGCSFAGVWADTNPPEEGSYWWCMMEGFDPENPSLVKANDWDVFHQPPGMLEVRIGANKYEYLPNPDAENLDNLPAGYYAHLCSGATREYVKVYVLGRYGTSKAGKPVHPLFDEERHVAKEPLLPNKSVPLILAADFGLTPAIALKQQNAFGQVLTLDEIVTEDMGLKRAIETRLWPLLKRKYPDMEYRVTGDPSGGNRSQSDEKTCIQIFKAAGFKHVKLASSNNPIARTGATDELLSRYTESGPGYLISPTCTYLRRGMKGGYHYKVNKAGVTSDEPEKNLFSHICEAGQYGDMYFVSNITTSRDESERARLLAAAQRGAGAYTRRG